MTVLNRRWAPKTAESPKRGLLARLRRPEPKRSAKPEEELGALEPYHAPKYLEIGPQIAAMPMPSSLYLYQLEGIYMLVNSPRLLLADDMGLGKTVQAIMAIRLLIRQGSIANALIVVPASLVRQWKDELQRWAPELTVVVAYGPQSARLQAWRSPAHVYLTSYETLRSDASSAPGPCSYMWDLVVLDEAQKIKNPKTKVSAACKAVSRKRAWILTGTPLENNLNELASVLSFLFPDQGILDCRGRVADFQTLIRVQHMSQFRRKREAVLKQLPRLQRFRLVLPLDRSQREAYESLLNEGLMHLASMGSAVTAEHVLTLITRLKQVCNFCPETGASAKAEDLRQRLGEIVAQGHKALVFSQFVCDQFGVRRIAQELADFEPLIYTGDMNSTERQRVVDKFNEPDGPRVLVVSLRAGGLGLNLQSASYVVHFDSWWNPAVTSQAESRAHRLGQRRTVVAYEYVMENTIEERIMEIIERKKKLFNDFVDDVSMAPPSISMTKADYMEALGLRLPDRSDEGSPQGWNQA